MLLCLFMRVWYFTCFLKCPSLCSFSEQGETAGWLCCCIVSVYDQLTWRAMRLIWDGCSGLLSCPYFSTAFGNPLIIVHSLRREQERMIFPSFPPSFSPGLLHEFLRIFNFPWTLSMQSLWQKFAWSVPAVGQLTGTDDNEMRTGLQVTP